MSGIMITAWEQKEYEELCAGRDRTLATMQAQMKLQNVQALELARKVVKLLDGVFDMEHMKETGAKDVVDVYDLANEIIAQE